MAEVEVLSTAVRVFSDHGFLASEFRSIPREVIARALTAAEDDLELRQQSPRVVEARRRLAVIRRRVLG